MLCDLKRRNIQYLRFSLTDLCNLRCHYCMPLEGLPRFSKDHVLSFEEIVRLIRILSRLGIRRVRFTGGEPLVRKGLSSLIEKVRAISGIEQVLLTTNGLLLKEQAQSLKNAGLSRINIHLDTLSAQKFNEITRFSKIESVFEGIQAAQEAGFTAIKLNMVLQRGINDQEVPDLLRFAAQHQLILRVIELMPIGEAIGQPERFVSVHEIKERLQQQFTLIPSLTQWGSGPARYQHVVELKTDIGFISPLSEPFCETCNRIRISSDGRLQDCLAYDGDLSLRELLRNPTLEDTDLSECIQDRLYYKASDHGGFLQKETQRTPCMYGIGG